jgi:hypothetical protein
MNKRTKNIILGLAILGLLAYFVFPGALVNDQITVIYTGKNNAPLVGAICYINDQNSKTTNSAGVAIFTLAREGRTEAGCYCPSTNTRTSASSYGTTINLNDPNCISSGGVTTTTLCPPSYSAVCAWDFGCQTGYRCVGGTTCVPACRSTPTTTTIPGCSPMCLYGCNSDLSCKSAPTTTHATTSTTHSHATTTTYPGQTTTTLAEDTASDQTFLIVGLFIGLAGLAYATKGMKI